jgi:hypothetical protein
LKLLRRIGFQPTSFFAFVEESLAGNYPCSTELYAIPWFAEWWVQRLPPDLD